MNFYIVDTKTGKDRGPVVMDPWDDISVEEVYYEVYEEEDEDDEVLADSTH